MISITKDEKEAIVKKFPNTNIVRTMKQKSKRHRYYCEEARPVMRLVKQIREGGCIANFSEGSVRNADRADCKRNQS